MSNKIVFAYVSRKQFLKGNEDVFAIVMDGFGWGDNGTLWGGELLKINGMT